MIEGVFNEPDADRRAAVIAEVFTEDVVFTDAERTVTGHAELGATVTGLLAQGPGPGLHAAPAVPRRGRPGHRERGARPAGEPPVARRSDVAQVVEGGLITAMWTMMDG